MGIAGWMDFLDDHPIQNKAITILYALVRSFLCDKRDRADLPGSPKTSKWQTAIFLLLYPCMIRSCGFFMDGVIPKEHKQSQCRSANHC